MSKPFPAIRYHGNQEAAVRHTKRGLYELFRAQDLQERMGVPIYKRTVEVNEYTTITVQIAMEQTFVHIYSNPPELPEVIPPPPEREESEPYGCPSAFIIRSQLDRGSAAQKNDGYIIAYNHLKKGWGIAKFKDKYGNTVPKAANLGWYHAKNSPTGVYSRCDVITWKGQSGPTFQPVSSPRGIFITNKFYFQGRKFNAPGPVLGACILQDSDGVDYVHVHTGIITIQEVGSLFHKCSHSFYRKKLSTVLSGSTENWESLGGLHGPADTVTFASHAIYWNVPRSTDYIDENGYAYMVLEYTGYVDGEYINQTTGGPLNHIRDGMTLYCKVDMRSGAYEVLSRSETSAPLRTAAGTYTWPSTGDGVYEGNNIENPWIFYVFPGTQDLYTLGMEHIYSHSAMEGSKAVNRPHQSTAYEMMSSGTSTTTMITYKNEKAIDRWVLNKSDYSFASEDYIYPSLNEEYNSIMAGLSGACSSKCTWLIEYHPEMPKNKIYMEYIIDAAGFNEVNFYRDGVKTNLGREDYGIGLAYQLITSFGLPYSAPYTYFGFWVPPASIEQFVQKFAGTYWAWNLNQSPYDYEGSCFADEPEWGPMNFGFWGNQPAGDIDGADVGPTYVFGLYPGYGHAVKIGAGTFTYAFKYAQLENWGSVYDFLLKQRAGDTPSTGVWMADAYAIHRPVGGSAEKPYLRLRKDLEISPDAFYNIIPGHVRVLPSFNDDTRIIMADEDPAYWGPGTNDYGESLGASNRQRQVWARPPGALQDSDADPDNETTHWNDKNWKLLSNFTSAEALNKITKEIGNAFFNIGIM